MIKIGPVATLRLFLAVGIILVAADFMEGIIGLGIPPWTSLYLIVSSLYLGFDPQKRVEKRSEEVFSYVFFPGAFVTALLPMFALILMVLGPWQR
jgi:hypothetical protein